MHEMSIAMDILQIVKDEMAKSNVTRLKGLKLRIGEMTAIEPDSLHFCFEAAVKDTSLEGAALYIEEVPLRGRCDSCESEFGLDRYFASPCPACGKKASEIVSGRELDIVSMEAE